MPEPYARCLLCRAPIVAMDDAEWTTVSGPRRDGLPRSVHVRCMEVMVAEMAAEVAARTRPLAAMEG